MCVLQNNKPVSSLNVAYLKVQHGLTLFLWFSSRPGFHFVTQ